jgi:hypothetical protein
MGKSGICIRSLIFEKSPDTEDFMQLRREVQGRSGYFLCCFSGRGDRFVQKIIGMCRRYKPGATLQSSHAAFEHRVAKCSVPFFVHCNQVSIFPWHFSQSKSNMKEAREPGD